MWQWRWDNNNNIGIEVNFFGIPYLKPQHYFFSSWPFTRKLAPILDHRADYWVSWYLTDGRTPWTGDQLVARPLPVHKHRKTRTHIKHPCTRRDSNPQSRPPSDRRLFMPQSARLPRPAHATVGITKSNYTLTCIHHVSSCVFSAIARQSSWSSFIERKEKRFEDMLPNRLV
jgi:hypothetical protein